MNEIQSWINTMPSHRSRRAVRGVVDYLIDNIPYEVDALTYGGTSFTQATIEAALTAIGTVNKTTLLLRPGTWVISSNADWSAYTNVTFKIVPGTVISRGAFTVNIPNVDAGDYQWLSGAGAVTFSGQTRISKPIWFGTDGTADQTEIQYAANALSSGGTLDLTGNFTITDAPVIGVANTKVISNGGTLTIAAKIIYGIRLNANYCTVTGLTIDATGYKDDGGTSSGRGAIHVTNGISYSTITKNTIIKASGSGIVDDGDYSHISDNTILETGEHGIYSSSAIGSTYTDNLIVNAGKDSALTGPSCYGIKIDGSIRSTFKGNVIIDSQMLGIQLASTASLNTIIGNTIYNSAATAQNAISISGGTSQRNTISGNTFNQKVAYPAIDLTTDSGNNLVEGNIVTMGAIAYGISNSGPYNTIRGNKLSADATITTAGIYSAATNTVIENNEILSGTGTWQYGVSLAGDITDNKVLGNRIEATTPYLITQTNRDVIVRSDVQPIASIGTTDATATNLYTFAPKASGTYYITARVISTGTNNAAYTIAGLFTTDGSAAPTQIGTTTAISAIESDAAFDCDFVEEAGYIHVRVTGKAANTQTWKLQSFDWVKI